MLGPSPQGRLEISHIRTPRAQRDTGGFSFEVYQDLAYSKKIAQVLPQYVLKGTELDPGTITIDYVRPVERGVQLFTDITIAFTTEHTMYSPAFITLEFPSSIKLPNTGETVKIVAQGGTKAYFKVGSGVV
jgi:hypothetical protein